MRRVLKESDVILLVLDARMPVLSMNREIKEKVEQSRKELFLLFNKIDLIPISALQKLKAEHADAFFVSAAKRKGINDIMRELTIVAERNNIGMLHVGMVGYPNVGKSSIINALTKRSAARVSNLAGTTKGIQWITVGKLKFLDSPGVIPYEDNAAKLGILGAKNPEKLDNPVIVAHEIIKNFLENDKETLEKHYKIKFSDDVEEIFEAIGNRRGYLSKGGIVDEKKTAIHIIREWQRGKLVRR